MNTKPTTRTDGLTWWTCPACRKSYKVPPGGQIECWCEVVFVPDPPGANRDDPYPGPTFTQLPNIHTSPVAPLRQDKR